MFEYFSGVAVREEVAERMCEETCELSDTGVMFPLLEGRENRLGALLDPVSVG